MDRLTGSLVPAAKALYRQPVMRIAAAYRPLLARTRVVGVTGSVGKTTTKELLARTLAARFRTVRSQLSNNDDYNTARTVLRVRPWTQVCVQEIGTDGPGSIDAPLSLLRPDIAVVTTIGLDHYRAFRTREAVAAEKSKLVRSVGAAGLAVLNADDPHVAAMATACAGRVVWYGQAPSADLQVLSVEGEWPNGLLVCVRWQGRTATVRTGLHGRYFATSVAAALATAVALGIDIDAACRALDAVQPVPGRMSVTRSPDGVTWLRDDFKASFWSVGFPFDYLASCTAGVARRRIVLGTVADHPGKDSAAYAKVLAHAARCAHDVIIVGERAQYAPIAALRHPDTGFHGFPTLRKAADWMARTRRAGDLVLLKGGTQDHLARLALVGTRQVACWRERCGRRIACEVCPMISVPDQREVTPA
jgi:UDP-N-acetylmuramyl pentapeptide synthase